MAGIGGKVVKEAGSRSWLKNGAKEVVAAGEKVYLSAATKTKKGTKETSIIG